MKKVKSDVRFQIAGHAIMILYSVICIIPFLLLFSSSVSDDTAILANGYALIPEKISFDAFAYLFKEGGQLVRAYGMTVLVTAIGTALGLLCTIMLAYALTKTDLPGIHIINFLVFFTMLFNGGLVPTYLMYTQFFHIKNTVWALIVPSLLVNGFNVMIARSFLTANIPLALLEAARIDGAGEIFIFFRIVLPLAKPILATIGLFIGINYWNDWMNGLYYLTEPKLFTIQNILNRILSDAQFLANNSQVAAHLGESAGRIPTTTVRMAIAVVGIIPVLIVYPFVQKYFVKGIALGAVKG